MKCSSILSEVHLAIKLRFFNLIFLLKQDKKPLIQDELRGIRCELEMTLRSNYGRRQFV